ncbi:hypothetical protein IFR05_014699 [Cadophora sp. M221]|nr:hypothetical protein IFR05_014699 [Cadophora sp. M221]
MSRPRLEYGRIWTELLQEDETGQQHDEFDEPMPSIPYLESQYPWTPQSASTFLRLLNEPLTPTPAQRQQQQRRPLRRTHIEAASAGISPPPRVRFAQNQPRSEELTHDFDEDLASSTPVASSQHYSPEAERKPHRALRISRTTASAILYTLEEALRQPNPFTSDLVEENASMSDLIGGGPGAAGNGRSGNGRAQPPPGTSGSPGLKGPREIMRERTAREARKRAENEQKEALERARAAEEARLLEQERRRSAERRAAAAAGAAAQQRASRESGQRTSGETAGQRVSDGSQQRRSDPPQEELQGLGRGGRAMGGGESVPTARPRPTHQQQPQAPRPVPGTSRPRPAQADPEGGPDLTPQPATRSSFPHAFERWETLSAHWEGLTSFWIRRLEENSNDLNRDPLSQQLSRQVTDLSAAGANLFHAVVELQRLRASSERKFQRWFFDTRAEQERAQEVQAVLETNLETERAERAAAINEAVSREREKTNVTKQLAEMKRELQISKEEARRAWEELGRREQEERDRTAALKDGRPTLIGGVQVVPMMQGVPSRHASARDPSKDTQYATIDAPEPEGPIDDSDIAYQQYARSQRSEPADPFTETRASSRPTATSARPAVYSEDSLPTHPAFTNSEHSAAPAVQPASTSVFYQQNQGTSLHPDPTYRQPSVPSEAGAMSEEEYEIDSQGQFIRDARGNKIRYQGPPSDADTDEYDVASEREREQANLQRYGPVSGVEYGRGSTTTSGPGRAPTSNPTIGEPVDYSGQGYGAAAPEWAAVPRHHHPTRLSDVLEEDERSRTSAGQRSGRE